MFNLQINLGLRSYCQFFALTLMLQIILVSVAMVSITIYTVILNFDIEQQLFYTLFHSSSYVAVQYGESCQIMKKKNNMCAIAMCSCVHHQQLPYRVLQK